MNWLIDTLTSTLGRKLIMALTGIFLILFLAVHLIGNFQLLYGDEGKAFNIYAEFMSSNGFIQFVSKGNFFFIILHVITSILLVRKNRAARSVDYNVAVQSNTSSWSSRNMGILGTLVFVFLVIHLRGFWYEMHYGNVPVVNYDGADTRDLYTVVSTAYAQWYWVLIYVVSMIVIGFHLAHGFKSAFQTLGLNHVKYSPIIKLVGTVFAVLVPAAFAAIPVIMHFN